MSKKIFGMIVAIETDAIFQYYGKFEELSAPKGYRLFLVEKENCKLYVLRTGMGEIAAAAGVQFLISYCNPTAIINFGVVGGMTAEMSKQKVCVVERVVHYKYDCSEFMDLKIGQVDGHDSIFLKADEQLLKLACEAEPELKKVTCCSGDKFIGSAEEKSYLHSTFEGDICDMESAGIVLACEMNGVPCIMFKAVSDGLSDGADGFYSELLKASVECLKVTDKIIENL